MTTTVSTGWPMGVQHRRAFAAADWACRTLAPLALESCGMTEQAERMRSLPPVVDAYTARLAEIRAFNCSMTAQPGRLAEYSVSSSAVYRAAFGAAYAVADAIVLGEQHRAADTAAAAAVSSAGAIFTAQQPSPPHPQQEMVRLLQDLLRRLESA